MTYRLNKWLLALALVFPLGVLGSNDKGNGGDGVILANGSIVLYDFFERSLDAEARAIEWRRIAADHWNHGLEYELFGAQFESLHGPLWEGEPGRAVIRDLTIYLDRIAEVYPTLARTLIDQIKGLHWTAAAVDLRPNPDTASSLDLQQLKSLGCARTQAGTVLYSPSCAGTRMSAANRAGLVLHEAFYNYYKELFPETETSFNIRTFIASILDPRNATTSQWDRILTSIRLGRAMTEAQSIREIFFNRNRGFSRSIDCTFPGSGIKDLTLHFSGPFTVRGYLNLIDEELNKGDRNFVIGTTSSVSNNPNWEKDPTDFGAWLARVPLYDIHARTMSIEIVNDEEYTLELTFPEYGSRTVSAIFHDPNDEHRPVTLSGVCNR